MSSNEEGAVSLTVEVISGLGATDQVIVDAANFNVAADNPGDVQVFSGVLDLKLTNTNIPVLELRGGDVLIDGGNAGSGSLSVTQLLVTNPGSAIIGSNTTTPDDVLNIGTSGFNMQQSVELSGLTVNSSGTTTTDTGTSDVLDLTGSTTFNNSGIFELQGGADSIVSTDATGTFNNTGTLAYTGSSTAAIGSTATGSDLTFQNAGGTISVASGGELEFRDGGTFTGVTTLNTAAGAGTIDFNSGIFTFEETATVGGNANEKSIRLGSSNGTLAIQGSLSLDSLTMAGGDVQLDSNNDSSSVLNIEQLIVSGTGSSITGANSGTVDDTVNISSVGSIQLNQSFELSALNVSTAGSVTTDTGPSDILDLTAGTVFTNQGGGTFELQSSSDAIVSSDGTGTFTNAGTLSKTGTNTSFIGSTATGSNLIFQNAGGTISVASGGELQFEDGGTFTGVTTLNTSAGAGKIDFNRARSRWMSRRHSRVAPTT